MRTFVRAISKIISGTRVRMRVTEYTWLNSWLIIRSGIRMFGFTQRRVVSRLPWAPIPASCYCHGIFLSFFLLFFPHSFIRSFVRSFVCLFLFFPPFLRGNTIIFAYARDSTLLIQRDIECPTLEKFADIPFPAFVKPGGKNGQERWIQRSTSKYSERGRS